MKFLKNYFANVAAKFTPIVAKAKNAKFASVAINFTKIAANSAHAKSTAKFAPIVATNATKFTAAKSAASTIFSAFVNSAHAQNFPKTAKSNTNFTPPKLAANFTPKITAALALTPAKTAIKSTTKSTLAKFKAALTPKKSALTKLAATLAIITLITPPAANALNLQNKFSDFSAGNDFYEDDSYIFTQNAYAIGGDTLKTYARTNAKDAINAAPFATLTGTKSGALVDMRSNGLRGAKFLINGFDASPALVNFSGFSPLNFVPAAFIDELSLQPQSLATQLGSGTKGGAVGISTHSRKAAFEVGGAYEQGSGYGGHILYKGALFESLFVNLGFAYNAPSDFTLDKATQMQAFFTLFFTPNEHNEVILGANFMQAKANENAPNGFAGSFPNYDTIAAGYKQHPYLNSIRNLYPMMYREKAAQAPDLNPDSTEFSGTPQKLTQQWLNLNLGYKINFTPKISLDLKGFYATNAVKKDDLSYTKEFFEWGGFVYKDSFLSISDFGYNESKIGFNAEFAWEYSLGKFTLGTQNLIENAGSKDAFSFENYQKFVISNNNHAQFAGEYQNELKITQSKNAVYANKRFDLSSIFSLAGGARYELYKAKLEVDGLHKNEHRYIHYNADVYNPTLSGFGATNENYSGENSKKFLAYEFLANLKYSNSGLLYARYERGYTALPAQFLAQRNYKNLINTTPSIQGSGNLGQHIHIGYADLEYKKSEFDDEIYDSFELGLKDFFALENGILALNANAYYIGTQNEFYQIRNYNPFVEVRDYYNGAKDAVYAVNPSIVGVWEKTRRMGVELFLAQFLFNGRVNFNESLAYQKAEFQGENGWAKIPYTYDYKATLSANVELFKWLNLWGNASFFGAQKVLNKSYSTTTYRGYQVPITQGLAGGNGGLIVENENEEFLPSFWLLDLGVGLHFGAFHINGGVKNLLDTLHYDYYNRDLLGTNLGNGYAGNGYVIAKGRRFFVEMNFTW